MTSVRLGDNLDTRLKYLAKTTARSKTFYIKEAVQKYLNEHEETLLVLNTREKIKRGVEKTYTLDEIEELFDLKDDE